jgi:hypothetical protein
MPFDIETPKTQFKLPPADTHVARCVSIIDLGTQEVEWQGQKKYQRKLRFSWELPNELEIFNEEKGEQPFLVSKDYTLSFNDKAALKADLESWRGKPFTPAEMFQFDERKVVGAPCMLTIIHREKEGKTYANITNITKLLKGTTCPEQINPSIVYNTKEGDSVIYKALPEWLRNKIAKSPEFQKAIGNHHDATEKEFEDETIPF